jgi:cell division septal protein FtsQ
VRISLVATERQSQRRRRRRSRGRGARTYDAAVSQPWEQPAWRDRKVRTVSSRGQAEPEPKADGALYSAFRRVTARILAWLTPARWLSALALAGLLGAMGFTSFDMMFFVYESRIVGARHLDASLIYEKAGIHEQNIFWIQPSAVAGNVIEVLGVKAARVRCDLPSDVTIEVIEREPAVLWRSLTQGRDYWLDEEGLVLPYHGDPSSPSTIFVVDSSDRQLEEGARIEPEGLTQSVLQLAKAMPQARLFFYAADRGLSYRQQIDGADWIVHVGTGDYIQRKIQAVSVITNYLRTNNIRARYIDVRWPDRPVYGLSGG